MPTDSLTELAELIATGLPGPEGGVRPRIEALFGDRYGSDMDPGIAVSSARPLAGSGNTVRS